MFKLQIVCEERGRGKKEGTPRDNVVFNVRVCARVCVCVLERLHVCCYPVSPLI